MQNNYLISEDCVDKSAGRHGQCFHMEASICFKHQFFLLGSQSYGEADRFLLPTLYMLIQWVKILVQDEWTSFHWIPGIEKKISSWRKINVISCKESLTTKTHKIPSLSHCLQSEISSLCELWKGCFDWHIRTVTITQWSYLLESCKCPRWPTLVLTRTDVDSFWPWLLPQTCPFLT